MLYLIYPTTGSPTITLLRLRCSNSHLINKTLTNKKKIKLKKLLYFKDSLFPKRDGRSVQDPINHSP